MMDEIFVCEVGGSTGLECQYCEVRPATNSTQDGPAETLEDCETTDCCDCRVCGDCYLKNSELCMGCNSTFCSKCLGEACLGCFGYFCKDCRKQCVHCKYTLCHREFDAKSGKCVACELDDIRLKARRIVSYEQRKF